MTKKNTSASASGAGNSAGTSGRATSAGILFDASGTVPAYLSRTDHRQQASGHRNKWKILPLEEYGIFITSHKEKYVCDKKHNWGVGIKFEEFGTDGERIAKFPNPSNPSDERHGYPVSARDSKREFEHRPPATLTSRWRDKGYISEIEKARIDRGKV
ncbi:hypothetical protein [Pseudarthrobacter sp. CCNWLW207]|uniref:hypothetical protein n=1 Tax=Pseudarthrobacter sp. CCNWLW207 TaxID=3127468 RepID=UPI0030782409